jgi:hypothetical protein
MTKITLAIVTALIAVGCSPTKADAKSNEEKYIATPVQETVVQVEQNVAPPLLLDKRIARSNRVHPEFQAAVTKQAKDLKGYEKSLYRGKYYYKSQEAWRKCVMDRESNFRYKAKNRSSSASGAYQFLDNNWRDGLVWMMIKESKKTDDNLDPYLRDLFDVHITKWNRYFQDRAFFTALNFEGKWAGKKHWNATVSGTGC